MLLEPFFVLLEFCPLVWAIPVLAASSPGFWLAPVPDISVLSVRLMSLCHLPQLTTCFLDSKLSAPNLSLPLGQLPFPLCPSHPWLPLASGLPLSGDSVLKSQRASFGSFNSNKWPPVHPCGASLIYIHEVCNSPSRPKQ